VRAAVVGLLVLASASFVSAHGARMRRDVEDAFAPQVVLAHRLELGLRPGQIEAIEAAMLETHQKLLALQWKLDADNEKLSQLLAKDRVDQGKVQATFDEVTAVEHDVKKANLTLLVRVKNLLDSEQRAKLRALRAASPE
jgi:Spy/CpxP family protein refolding chaperone